MFGIENAKKAIFRENELRFSNLLHPIISIIAQEGYVWKSIAPVIITVGSDLTRSYSQSTTDGYNSETVYSSEVRIAKPAGYDENELAIINVRQHVEIGEPTIYQASVQREINQGSRIGDVMQIGRDNVSYCKKPADRNAVIMHLYLELLQRGLDLSNL
ncbi:hypothetical protein COT87_01005 [Candidatus Collierbacteria bacterium CG10_big_fil_rev_8_21_14_0_10_44_9]|uniref:Uncharacterized protein n=1 Tax=Candidatus Collierbacteria bacterium CG10_big_fil_rev_8_21_14_0_10_44_9 TaxID=1974535 RepID=A0A2H0VJA4_9BACT|nr:MAG: hypothetical protein COT87_01005 [Candidatus Collierbacteria bacterium CG10_big_fil_rev_8_21_14_0_10_44_9]